MKIYRYKQLHDPNRLLFTFQTQEALLSPESPKTV